VMGVMACHGHTVPGKRTVAPIKSQRGGTLGKRDGTVILAREGLGGTEPFLSRSVWCDTGLSRILHFG
jgi:hypothetical protein